MISNVRRVIYAINHLQMRGKEWCKGKMSVHVLLKKCDEWLQKQWTQKRPKEQGEDEARKADCGTGEWRGMMARITRAT